MTNELLGDSFDEPEGPLDPDLVKSAKDMEEAMRKAQHNVIKIGRAGCGSHTWETIHDAEGNAHVIGPAGAPAPDNADEIKWSRWDSPHALSKLLELSGKSREFTRMIRQGLLEHEREHEKKYRVALKHFPAQNRAAAMTHDEKNN